MKPVVAEPQEATRDTGRPTAATRWALGGLALSMLLSSLGVSVPNVALPTLTHAFSASFAAVQWVVIAYLLAITVTVVSAGRLGDLLGRRRVLLAGIGLFTGASILCGIAPALWMLIVARAAQGLGAAILMTLTVALVRETVPKERTGGAMGLLGTMSAVGTALGPSLGGVLVAGPGWRAIFLVMASLALLNFLLVRRFLPDQGDAPERNGDGGFDAMGTLLLGLTLAAYALAATLGSGNFGRLNLILLLLACLGTGLFLLAEARVTSPLVRPEAFRDAALNTSLVMNALVATVMMATLVVGPFYLSRALGLNEAVVGIVMSIGPAISALSGVPAGRLVDRFGAPLVIVAGLLQMTAGTVALATLPGMFGVTGYIAAIAVLTPGYQLFQAANNTAVMMDSGSAQRGVISGLLSLSRNFGLITGASVMGAVFAFAAGTSDITAAHATAVATGMQTTFAVAAMLTVAAAAMSLGRQVPATAPETGKE